jgi:hypothetical protein
MSLAKDCGYAVTISNREKIMSVILTKIILNWKIKRVALTVIVLSIYFLHDLYVILKPNSQNTGK